MKPSLLLPFFACLLAVAGLTRCSEYNKMLKSGNIEEKLEYAAAALDSGNCFRALPLYDEQFFPSESHSVADLPFQLGECEVAMAVAGVLTQWASLFADSIKNVQESEI